MHSILDINSKERLVAHLEGTTAALKAGLGESLPFIFRVKIWAPESGLNAPLPSCIHFRFHPPWSIQEMSRFIQWYCAILGSKMFPYRLQCAISLDDAPLQTQERSVPLLWARTTPNITLALPRWVTEKKLSERHPLCLYSAVCEEGKWVLLCWRVEPRVERRVERRELREPREQYTSSQHMDTSSESDSDMEEDEERKTRGSKSEKKTPAPAPLAKEIQTLNPPQDSNAHLQLTPATFVFGSCSSPTLYDWVHAFKYQDLLQHPLQVTFPFPNPMDPLEVSE